MKEFDVRKIEGDENTYRIRIGDFRVIYFVDKEGRTIHILKLEKRGRIILKLKEQKTRLQIFLLKRIRI